MYGMGVLFIVMAIIIALRNLYLVSTNFSFRVYIDNYINAQITNEKFVIAMIVAGAILIYWGHFKRKDNHTSEGDEYEKSKFKHGR